MLKTSAAPALILALGVLAAPLPAPAQGPPAPPAVSKDPAVAPAGEYRIDKSHAAVVAKVPHAGGMSISVVRFGDVAGTLSWNPAAIEGSKLSVVVGTTTISSPVTFIIPLTGPLILNSEKFPQVTFVSTSIHRTGPTTGDITGDLTLMGVTKPVVIHGELIGAGRNAAGRPTMGFSGRTHFVGADFGLKGPPSAPIDMELDVEFNKS